MQASTIPPYTLDVAFGDLSGTARAWLVAEMQTAFGMAVPLREVDWPARWWSSRVVILGEARALYLPRRGVLRPSYLDKLWSARQGEGHGGILMTVLSSRERDMYWRTHNPGWYMRWSWRSGRPVQHWPYGSYTHMRSTDHRRQWEAEDVEWLTMPSAWG